MRNSWGGLPLPMVCVRDASRRGQACRGRRAGYCRWRGSDRACCSGWCGRWRGAWPGEHRAGAQARCQERGRNEVSTMHAVSILEGMWPGCRELSERSEDPVGRRGAASSGVDPWSSSKGKSLPKVLVRGRPESQGNPRSTCKSGCRDLNPGPLAPKASARTNCATPRTACILSDAPERSGIRYQPPVRFLLRIASCSADSISI